MAGMVTQIESTDEDDNVHVHTSDIEVNAIVNVANALVAAGYSVCQVVRDGHFTCLAMTKMFGKTFYITVDPADLNDLESAFLNS